MYRKDRRANWWRRNGFHVAKHLPYGIEKKDRDYGFIPRVGVEIYATFDISKGRARAKAKKQIRQELEDLHFDHLDEDLWQEWYEEKRYLDDLWCLGHWNRDFARR